MTAEGGHVRSRVFVVGCPRSGTSLLQKHLAERLRLWTLPETAFFLQALDTPGGRLRALGKLHYCGRGMPLDKRFNRLRALLSFSRAPGLLRLWQALAGSAGCTRLFRDWLDAQAAGHPGWLEKTPGHLHHLDTIRAAVPGARFVLLVREGEAVVASLHDRNRRHAAVFARHQDFRDNIRCWNDSLAVAIANRACADVRLVFFEDFVRDPESVLAHLAVWLDLPLQPSCAQAAAVAGPAEVWKQGLQQPIAAPASKFAQVFSAAEQQQIRQALDSDRYHRLRAG